MRSFPRYFDLLSRYSTRVLCDLCGLGWNKIGAVANIGIAPTASKSSRQQLWVSPGEGMWLHLSLELRSTTSSMVQIARSQTILFVYLQLYPIARCLTSVAFRVGVEAVIPHAEGTASIAWSVHVVAYAAWNNMVGNGRPEHG